MIGNPKDLFYSPIRTTDFQWNFEKILVDHKGRPRKRYTPKFNPLEMKSDVKNLVEECVKARKKRANIQFTENAHFYNV